MGVSASLKAVDPNDLESIRNDSDRLLAYLFGRPLPSQEQKRPLLGRIFGSKDEPKSKVAGPVDTPSVSLGGHWGILTYALTGPDAAPDHPLDLVERDFDSFSTVDLGYGVPRLIPNRDLVAFHQALENLSDEQIVGRLNAAEMERENIYERDEILTNLDQWKAALAAKVSELRNFADYCVKNHSDALVYFA